MNQDEQRHAEKWIAKHGVGSLPGPRRDNGESASQERSDWLSGADRGQTGATGGSRSLTSYDQFDTPEAWEDWMLDAGNPYLPLVGGSVAEATMDQLEKRARMRNVLSRLLPAHVELLFERHVRGRTLDDIAEEHFVTRQAIIKRLRVAEQDFRREFGLHWLDHVEVDQELLMQLEQRGPGGSL